VTEPEGAAAQDPKNVQEGREVPLRNVIFLSLLNCCTLLNGKFRNELKVFPVICAKNLKKIVNLPFLQVFFKLVNHKYFYFLQELTNYIQNMLQQMQERFQTMSDQIISRYHP
jgi:hypothetical protein